MSEFQVGDIVSFSRHAITRRQNLPGYHGECYDGHWEVAEVHAQYLQLVQGERNLFANPKFVPNTLELVERADPVFAMVHPIDLGERREATHADVARLSSGRSFPRGEAFSPEWDVVPQDERKPVVNRASPGLKKPPAEYIPGSFGEATSTIAKRLGRLIRQVAANTYIPPQYWVSPDVSRMDR